MDMHCLVLISCCWLLKKTFVITTNLTNPESALKRVLRVGKKVLQVLRVFMRLLWETRQAVRVL